MKGIKLKEQEKKERTKNDKNETEHTRTVG